MAVRKTMAIAALAGVIGIFLCFPTNLDAAHRFYRIDEVPGYEYIPFIFRETVHWHYCERLCMSFGGHLISLRYPGEEIYGLRHLWFNKALSASGYVWIGMNRLEDDSRWEWSDNTTDVRGFGSKLGLGDRNKKCAAQFIQRWSHRKENVTLKTVMLNCDMGLKLFICKRKINDTTLKTKSVPSKVDGATCPEGWRDAGTSRCYKTFEHETGLDWKTAEASCLSLPYYRPNLACVTTAEEAGLLARIVTQRTPARFWFGLFRESVDGLWMWTDNNAVDYTNFHRHFEQDFDYGEGVVDNRAIPRGSWDLATSRDGVRSKIKRYICQVEKE